MAARQSPQLLSSVLSRVIRLERDDLSPEAARCFLKLAFDPADLARMNDLATKGQKGGLTDQESALIAEYRQAGLLIDLLKSKARLSLKKHGLTGD